MNRRWLSHASLALFFGLLPYWCGEAAGQQRSYSKPEKTAAEADAGLKVVSRTVPLQDGRSVGLQYVRLDPKRFLIRVAAPEAVSGGYSLERFILEEKAALAFSGGYLKTLSPATPSGLMKIGGKVISQLAGVAEDKVLSGLICFQRAGKGGGTQAEIFSSGDGAYSKFSDCLQGGPLLILNGHPASENLDLGDHLAPTFSHKERVRSFVALDAQKNLFLGITSPAALDALMLALHRSEGEGGLGAVAAMNMSGSTAAGLALADESEKPVGSTSMLLPNAIVVNKLRY